MINSETAVVTMIKPLLPHLPHHPWRARKSPLQPPPAITR